MAKRADYGTVIAVIGLGIATVLTVAFAEAPRWLDLALCAYSFFVIWALLVILTERRREALKGHLDKPTYAQLYAP